jgi:hypothetical protein
MAMLIPLESLNTDERARLLKAGGHIISFQERFYLRIHPSAYAEAEAENDDEQQWEENNG